MNRPSTSLKSRFSALSLATLGLLGAHSAQAEIFEAQGTIRSITTNANGTVTLVCGNMVTIVDNNTEIRTPVGQITLAQLTSTTPFPNAGFNALTGAPRAGFVGGTCVAAGDDAIVPGQRTVVLLEVEIEENLLLGGKTAGQGYQIQGVPVVPLTDSRLSIIKPAAGFYNANGSHPANPTGAAVVNNTLNTATGNINLEMARNEYGFGIDLNTVPVGDLGASEGYYGSDGRFYAFIIETTGGTPLRTEPRPSALRAQCRNDLNRPRDEIEVRGGCLLPRNQPNATVTIEGMLPNGNFQTYGTTACNVAGDAVPGPNYQFGLYRFGATNLTLTNNACPAQIRVRTTIGNITRYDFIEVDAR